MTIKDPEVVEALRSEPELLALADAIQSTQSRLEPLPAPRRVGSRRFRLAAVAVAATAALILALVSPWETGGPSLVDRALAAVGDRPVLHMAIRYTSGARVDLRTGRSSPLSRYGEVWYDTARHVFRSVARIDGHVVYRAVGTTRSLGLDDPTAYATLYLQALKEGKVRKVGESVVRGHRVIVLTGGGQGGTVRASLDARTFALVRLQFFQGGSLQSQLDVLVLETLTRAQAHLPRTAPKLNMGGSSSSSGGSLRSLLPGKARSAFAQAPLWVGPAIGGHRLAFIRLEKATATQGTVTAHGRLLHIGYGPGSRGGFEPFLGIEEAPAASVLRLWSLEGDYVPPAGYLDLRTSGTRARPAISGPGTEQTQWTGLMQKRGFALRLTSLGRDTLIAAARALRPLPPG